MVRCRRITKEWGSDFVVTPSFSPKEALQSRRRQSQDGLTMDVSSGPIRRRCGALMKNELSSR
jgi:hypothetical protein